MGQSIIARRGGADDLVQRLSAIQNWSAFGPQVTSTGSYGWKEGTTVSLPSNKICFIHFNVDSGGTGGLFLLVDNGRVLFTNSYAGFAASVANNRVTLTKRPYQRTVTAIIGTN